MGIYILRAVGTEFAKIGFTDNESPEERLKACQTGCPFVLEERLFLPFGEREDETFLKNSFSRNAAPAGNEWFTLTDQNIDAISKYIKSRYVTRAEILIDQALSDVADALFVLSNAPCSQEMTRDILNKMAELVV